jgi:hypothetical protein
MSSNPQNIVTIADLLLQILDPTGITNHLLNEPIPSTPIPSTLQQIATETTGTEARDAPEAEAAATGATDLSGAIPSALRITTPTAPALMALNNSIRLQRFINLLNRMELTEEAYGDVVDAEADADAEAEPEAVAAPPRLPGLAGFARDRENVHTRPAQTETSRAIQVLMDPAPDTWKTLFKAWTDFLGEDSVAPDVQAVQNFLAEDLPYSVMVGDHEFRTKASLQDVFCGLMSFAQTLPPDLRSALSWDLRELWVLDSSRARIEKVAELLCNWNPAFSSDSHITSWLHYWVTHQHDTLLFSVRNTWCEALAGSATASATATWHRVIEEPVWTEFRYDVYNTENFDIRYGDLLQRIWDYALAHSDVKNEIGVRLAEEVLDGVGMCPQGKMTRLANVLRGFDPRLESVSTLSTREQLQNRMVTLRSLPMEERRVAAEAVFAELSIPAEEQEPWLDALLE